MQQFVLADSLLSAYDVEKEIIIHIFDDAVRYFIVHSNSRINSKYWLIFPNFTNRNERLDLCNVYNKHAYCTRKDQLCTRKK